MCRILGHRDHASGAEPLKLHTWSGLSTVPMCSFRLKNALFVKYVFISRCAQCRVLFRARNGDNDSLKF